MVTSENETSVELAALLPGLADRCDAVLAEPEEETRWRRAPGKRLALACKLLLGERDAWTSASGVTEPSELAAVLFNLGEERDALRARAEEAERKLSDVADLQRSTATDLDAARAQLRMVSAGPADVWRWQGDGHDDPASLACPVVMSAETLREFVAARERVTERAPVRIVTMQRTHDWHACVEGHQGIWGCGSTPDAAIGSMVMSHPDRFGVAAKGATYG